MEGFLPILFLWVIFAFVGNIAKKAQKAQQKNAPAAGKKPAAPKPPVQAQRPPQSAPQPMARPTVQPTVPTVSSHVSTPLEAHMHEPVMGEEGTGTEGIDCCHEYMLNAPAEAETNDFLPMTEQDQQDRSRALLKGVIFSEILGRRAPRPCGGRRS